MLCQNHAPLANPWASGTMRVTPAASHSSSCAARIGARRLAHPMHAAHVAKHTQRSALPTFQPSWEASHAHAEADADGGSRHHQLRTPLLDLPAFAARLDPQQVARIEQEGTAQAE
jgi:hypothetical protein